MRKATLAAIAVLGLLVLIVSASPVKANPARAGLSMGPGSASHMLNLGDRLTVQNDSQSRSIFESASGCVGTRCDQHIGVFSDRVPTTDVTAVPSTTPEPASLILVGSGLLIMGLALRRRSLASRA